MSSKTGHVSSTESPTTSAAEPANRRSSDGSSGRKRAGSTLGVQTATPSARSEIEKLVDAGFSKDEIYQLVIPRRSLERRIQSSQPLSPLEKDRALRLRRILDHALRVMGTSEKAQRWLRKPCRALDGAVPLELLASETGAHLVDMELHAIDHGMFA